MGVDIKSKILIILLLLTLTLLSISAVNAADSDATFDDSSLESQTQTDLELDSVESEIPESSNEILTISEDNNLKDNDGKQDLNRSYSFSPAEVEKDYPSVWINMEVDSSQDLGEGNVTIFFNDNLLEE